MDICRCEKTHQKGLIDSTSADEYLKRFRVLLRNRHSRAKQNTTCIITRPSPLLNYFLLIAKIYLLDCRRNQIFPNIVGFKAKIVLEYKTEAYITQKGNKIKFLQSNSELHSLTLLLVLLLFYVYRICILSFSHLNDYFLQISFAKLLVVSYVSYWRENNYVNVDAELPPLQNVLNVYTHHWVIVKKSSRKTCQLTVGRLSVDCRPSVAQLSAVCCLTVGQQTADS